MFTLHEDLPSLGNIEGQVCAPERRVRTSLPAIDSFFPGLRSSQVTLIDSSDRFLFDLTHLLCVNSIGDLGEEVVWVDGGNSINPYEIAALCRRFRLDLTEILDSVNIARAFTAYQMSSLIVDKLEREVERTRSGMVIISCFTDLFHDKDMWWSEAFQLMKRCLSSLRDMTQRRSLVTVVTNYGLTKISHKKSLGNLMEKETDTILRIENRRKVLELSLVKEGLSTLYHPVPYYQTTLDEFRR